MSVSTEFFKTLEQAKKFKPTGIGGVYTEIYSLDKPGTVLAFISERDQAIYNECRGEAKGSRAVVKIWR